MNLRDLEYVEAIGRFMSFSKAAVACNVSQPALSNQIKKLERELGTDLFERKLLEIRPTELGRRVIESAELLLSEAQKIRDMAMEYNDPTALPLRIGIVPTLAPYLANYLGDVIGTAMPAIKLAITEGPSADLNRSVINRDIDVAFIPRAFHDSPSTFTPLFTEPLFLAVQRGHSRANCTQIGFNEIPLEKLIIPQLPIGYSNEAEQLRLCPGIGSAVRMDVRSASLETICRYVGNSNDCTIIPGLAATRFGNEEWNLSLIPITDQGLVREIGVISRMGCPRKPLLAAIVDQVSSTPPPGVKLVQNTQDVAA